MLAPAMRCAAACRGMRICATLWERWDEAAAGSALGGQPGTSGGRLAQRESASFTPRRSLVRSQYRPPAQRLGLPRMAVEALGELLQRQAAARQRAGVLRQDDGLVSLQRSGRGSMRRMCAGRYGRSVLVTMRIGGGQDIAAVFERI